MGHRGASRKSPNGAPWKTRSLRLGGQIFAPILTAVLSWRYEEDCICTTADDYIRGFSAEGRVPAPLTLKLRLTASNFQTLITVMSYAPTTPLILSLKTHLPLHYSQK